MTTHKTCESVRAGHPDKRCDYISVLLSWESGSDQYKELREAVSEHED